MWLLFAPPGSHAHASRLLAAHLRDLPYTLSPPSRAPPTHLEVSSTAALPSDLDSVAREVSEFVR